MERFLYWCLFLLGIVLAAWVPVASAYPHLEARLVEFLMVTTRL